MSRMAQIKVLLESIESMKTTIIMVESNPNMPYVIKTRKLDDMRRALFQTERYALEQMELEMNSEMAS